MKPLIYLFAACGLVAFIAIKIEEKYFPVAIEKTFCHVEVHAHVDLVEAILDQVEREKQDSETPQETQDRHDQEQRDRDYERLS